MRVVLASASTLLVLMPIAACGGSSAPSSAEICATLCDCITCPAGYLEECETALDDAERQAAEAGCAEQYEAHTTCFVDEFRCDNNPIDLDDPPPTCVMERNAYESCIADATMESA